jgi:adenosine deaminase
MFHLLHLHFESVLRTVAVARPDLLKTMDQVFCSASYRAASPVQRLRLLDAHIQCLAQGHADLFTEQTFVRVVRAFVQELVRSRVEHADLRIGVRVQRWSWMHTIVDGIQIFERELQAYPHLSLSFLAALNFAKPRAELDEIFALLLTNQVVRAKILGIDVNVTPAHLPLFFHSIPQLLLAQRTGLKINIHLGELFENAISWAILSALVPNRIGHGVRLLDDERLVAFLKRHDICLDMCPVSNTRLGVWNWRLAQNPAKKAIQLGLPVTINTDDPVLFHTTLAQELALARLRPEEITLIQATGRRYSYAQR